MTQLKQQIPALEGFFTWPSDEPALIGSRCNSCGQYFFPKFVIQHNPACEDRQQVEEVKLSRKGTLWSYTIVHYEPPLPFRCIKPFKPYGLGVIELPEGIRLIGQLTGCDLDKLRSGIDVDLVIEKQYEDEGNEYMTWKFRPV